MNLDENLIWLTGFITDYEDLSFYTNHVHLKWLMTYSGGQGSVLQALWFSGGLLSGSQ